MWWNVEGVLNGVACWRPLSPHEILGGGDQARRYRAVHLAARDSRTPLSAKLMAAVVVAYALSPIDLIPDFVPILGYLDDLVLLPLGIMATVALIPTELMVEYRAAAEGVARLPASRIAGLAIVALWLVAAFALAWATYRLAG